MDSGTARDCQPPVVPNDAGRILPLLFLMAWLLCPRVVAQDAPAADDPGQDQDVQVLTQGPVHEAFAVAGGARPQGRAWWSRSSRRTRSRRCRRTRSRRARTSSGSPATGAGTTARNDYLWVSGVWREPPPGRQWVPGYWNQVDGRIPVGARRRGCRSARQSRRTGRPSPQSQATYLPPPPASLEAGPSSPSPGRTSSGRPGYWSWQGSRYVWRPGFWAAVQPNWVWMPAHYVWTPGGYLFVDGYWDLPVASRGLMFAPVYYPQPVYAQPGFVFTPSITIVGSATDRQPVRPAELRPLLLRQLLRPDLPQRRDLAVVLLQLLAPAGPVYL